MYANLFGDFVRGTDLSRFPENIQYGIRLHRAIDHYIDHHPAVIELLHQLYPKLPRISSIAVDLFFDHLLAREWHRFHETPLDDFLQDFYTAPMEYQSAYTDEFHLVVSRMRERNWIHHYQFLDGLDKVCNGVSRRISFKNNLHEGRSVFEEMETVISETFEIYMTDARNHFAEFT